VLKGVIANAICLVLQRGFTTAAFEAHVPSIWAKRGVNAEGAMSIRTMAD
jgi:hypothetical protein